MKDIRKKGAVNCLLVIVFFLSLFYLAGCVTVPETETVTPPATKHTSPVLQETPRYVLKRKVVIARFSNETLYGKSVLLGGNQDDLIARQAYDTLTTRLTEAEKFILFERADYRRILAALDQGKLHELNLPADYLIMGSVNEFGRDNLGKTGFFSRTKRQKASARVNVRLVDVQNSLVVFAQEGSGEAISETGTVMGMGTKSGYDSTLNDRAISAAIGAVVGNLVENLLEQPWRSYILDTEESNQILTISGGASQGLQVGHKLALIRRGKRVKNPQTGLLTELPGTRIAILQVTAVFGDTIEREVSKCRILSGNYPGGDPNQYVIEEEKL